MRRGRFKCIIFFICLAIGLGLKAQSTISTSISSNTRELLHNVKIVDLSNGNVTYTNEDGIFSLEVESDSVLLEISLVGYKTLSVFASDIDYEITIERDVLMMNEVIVSAAFDQDDRYSIGSATSTIQKSENFVDTKLGIADALKSIPGMVVDASVGEAMARVYSRGISSSAEDDLGWYYISLQEDGMPVSISQHTYFAPDLFVRDDIGYQRVEVLRGGDASLAGTNGPGGLINFISAPNSSALTAHWRNTYGNHKGNRHRFKSEFTIGGPLGNLEKASHFNISGFYRLDEGPRKVNANWNRGGQIKLNMSKTLPRGVVKLRFKYLHDQVNRYLGLPARTWTDPTAAFGVDFSTSAIMLPSFEAQIPDSRDFTRKIDFNPDDGIAINNFFGQFELVNELGQATLSIISKFDWKSAEWKSMIGNQPLGLENFIAYFLTSAENPWGQIDFRDATSNEVLASVNNLGALNAFQGLEPTFEYISGSLPNDAILGSGLWYKDDDASSWMNKVKLSLKKDNHHFVAAGFLGFSKVDMFTNASFVTSTYQDQPRMLVTQLVGPGGDITALSDQAGVSNYGGLFFEEGHANITLANLSIRDRLELNDRMTLEGGLKVEYLKHKGDRSIPTQIDRNGGIDGDLTTGYDNGAIVSSGQKSNFEFDYTTLDFSVSANQILSANQSVFLRFSKGNKAPELNYYLNNFSGVPIAEKAPVESIYQLEGGWNFNTPKFSISSVGFLNFMNNITSFDFALDESSGTIFYTPFQNNKTRAFGVETEFVYQPSTKFQVRGNATIQDTKSSSFTVYQANSSVDLGDDIVEDFSGNDIAHNPNVILNVNPTLILRDASIFTNWRYLGPRYANAANSFKMNGFSTFDIGTRWKVFEDFEVGLVVTNAFNSSGLMNFFGPNEFGSSANQATNDYIQQNPNASFVVFPINPRSIFFTLGYTFAK